MRGFPKHLNTKQDYLNTLKTMPDETKEHLRTIMEARFSWQPGKKLKDSEKPKETDTKKIVELPVSLPDGLELAEGEQPQVERWLYELKEDPNAWFFKLGFTVAEAETILSR